MKKAIIGALTAIAAVACTSVSTTTTLKGKFSGADVPEEVTVTIPGVIDTTVRLQNAAFKIVLPVYKAAFGQIAAGNAAGRFISDGTPLTAVLKDGYVEVTSEKPSVSLTERFNVFADEHQKLVASFRTKMAEIADSTGLSEQQKDSLKEEFYNDFNEGYSSFNMTALKSNVDNVISTVALQNVYSDMSDDELESTIAGMDSTVVANSRFISAVYGSIKARKATAEGMHFIDFSVKQPDGKTVKLSDYVGKGKYVLVDFWASWCRPCKHEIPNVKAVYDKHHGKDFDVLSVAVWENSPKESLDTAKAYGVNWNQIVDAKNVPTDLYGILGIPHIILFGPDGTIIKRGLHGEAIEEEVARYVK